MNGADQAAQRPTIRPPVGKATERARRAAVKSLRHNLLGAFTSRHSDWHGYWRLGFLVVDLDRRTVDLLAAEADSSGSPWDFAASLAATRFKEQAAKARVSIDTIAQAELEIVKL